MSASIASMNERVQHFANLCRCIKDTEASLKTMKGERAQLEELILTDLGDLGADRITTAGVTIYVRRDTYPVHLIDEATTVAALKASPHAEIVRERVNPQTLAALVREFLRDVPPEKEENAIPAELRGILGFCHQFKLGVRSQ